MKTGKTSDTPSLRSRSATGPEREILRAGTADSAPWWGTFEVPPGTCARWDIGPLSLWIERRREYCTVVRDRAEDAIQNRSAVTIPSELPEWSRTGTREAGNDVRTRTTSRIGASGDHGDLRILPAHADRPIVITPEQPFKLPPKRTIHLYVSLPLWYQVFDGPDGASPIVDEAVVRPSDTWHGPNTRLGQLCYSSRTRANVELVGRLPHRVVAPLEVRNDSGGDLQVERIKLPTPYLAIFSDGGDGLFTESVTFAKKDGRDDAEIRIDPDPRLKGPAMRRLNGPRVTAEKKFVWHAFGEMFGTSW